MPQKMKRRFWNYRNGWVVLLVIGVGMGLLSVRQAHSPRYRGLKVLSGLNSRLCARGSGSVVEFLVLPQALAGRSPQEQEIFTQKALAEELSEDGLKVLRKVAQFGPLMRLFPNEGLAWATQAGVKAEDCVAFRAERAGIRTEVVLILDEDSCRVVRCNNVRQLASVQASTQ